MKHCDPRTDPSGRGVFIFLFSVDIVPSKRYNNVYGLFTLILTYQEVGRTMDGDSKPNACNLTISSADPALLPTELY